MTPAARGPRPGPAPGLGIKLNKEVFMKAIAVYPPKKQVQLIDAPEPALKGPTDVKLKMLDIGVCGTDKEICTFEY